MRNWKYLFFIFITLYTLVFSIAINLFDKESWVGLFFIDTISLTGIIIGIIFSFITVIKCNEKVKYFWLLMLIGNTSYAISELICDYYDLILKIKISFPSLSDLFCYLQIFFYMLAIAYKLYEVKNTYKSAKFFFDAIIVIIALSTISWEYLMNPLFIQSNLSNLHIVTSIGYPIGDLVLLFGTISLYQSCNYVFPKTVIQTISFAFLILILADSFYTFFSLSNSYSSGSYFDPLWPIAIMLIGFAGLIYSVQYKFETNLCHNSSLNYFQVDKLRLSIPYATVIFLLIVILFKRENLDILFIGFSITIILLVIRQIITLLENQNLLKQLNILNMDLENQITERTQKLNDINTELIKSNEFKDDIISSMSHELRTPIHAILSYIQLIEDGDDGPVGDEILSDLQIIKRSSKRLLFLIANLLDLAKIQSNKNSVKLDKVDLSDLIQHTYEELYYLAAEKELELLLNIEDADNLILSDQMKLQQILINLVTNAIKFTSKGYVKISASVSDDSFQICVEDTGIGIPKEYHSYIFQKFTQIDHGTRRQYGGTGIGLAIVKSLVDSLQGEITLDSEPNCGSKFVVKVPL